ncbi:MAG: CHAT domain-containing protein [Lewinellaceae bacterium]|nr:CHAT domain-containing protein [Lewinellaceae bacterium]
MNFSSKILVLVCLLGFARAQGQECAQLLDSLNAWGNLGEFQKVEARIGYLDTVCLKEVGSQDTLYASVLSLKSSIQMMKGDYAGALELAQSSKIISLGFRGFYDLNTAVMYSNEGTLLTRMGQFDRAIADLDTALLIQNYLKDTSSSLGLTYLNRGQAFLSMGKYGKAKADLEISIENAHANGLERESYQYLLRINTLGVILSHLGEHQQATPILEETVQVAAGLFGAEYPTSIQCVGNLVLNYITVGAYDKALPNAREALRLAQKVMPGHPYTNLIRTNLGLLLQKLGQNAEALNLLLEAKSLADKQTDLDLANYAALLNNLGNSYLNFYDYASALPYLSDARELMIKTLGTKSPRYAKVNANLATCYFQMGDTQRAKQLADESFELVENFGETFPDFEKLLINTFLSAPKTESSLSGMQHANGIARKKFGENSTAYGSGLNYYGATLTHLGRPQEAILLLQDAEQILRSTVGIKSKDYLDVLRNLATCQERLGNTQKSLDFFQEACALAEEVTGRKNSFYAFLMQGRAGIEERSGKTRLAFGHYLTADTIYRSLAIRNFAVLSDVGREAFLADIQPQLDHWYSFAWRHAASFPEIPGLLFDDQLSQKGQLLSSARAVLASLRGDSILAAQMVQWLGLRQMIDYQRTLLAQKDINAQYTFFELDSLARAAELTEAHLAQKSKAFETATRPIGWRNVQALLAPDEAAVEFFHFNFAKPDSPTDSILYGALVLRSNDEQPRFIPLFEEKQLAFLLENEGLSIDEWLGKIYPSRSPEPSELYRLIWHPLESYLSGVRRVWYAPSGLLHKVSLPAIAKAHGERLVEKYSLQQMGSTRELAAAMPLPVGPPQSALIFACVSYPTDTIKMQSRTRECLGEAELVATKDGSQSKPDPLPNSLPEADTVAVQLQGVEAKVEIRIGYEALEEDFKKSLVDEPPPDVLMFTTHGFALDTLPEAFRGRFPPRNPMYSSGLLLAGAEQAWTGGHAAPGFQDGILTAREIGDLNLQGTRLAILSACESGLGESKSSEGVYGLQRAFKIAGTRQVLATLWKIPDSRETQEFVGQFCHRWLASGDARDALQKTQLDFLRRGKQVQVWGGWVLI